MGGPQGGHMGGPPMQNQAPPQGDRFQAVTAYRFVGGSGHKITLFIMYTNNEKNILYIYPQKKEGAGAAPKQTCASAAP